MDQPENRVRSVSLGELVLAHEGHRPENRRRVAGRRCARNSYLWHGDHSKAPSAVHDREEYYASFRKSTIQTPEARFNGFLRDWRRATGSLSVARQIQSHRTYLKIIGMGAPALKYLLAEVQKGRRFLFVALESIADEYPAKEAESFEQVQNAWIEWGKDQGLI